MNRKAVSSLRLQIFRSTRSGGFGMGMMKESVAFIAMSALAAAMPVTSRAAIDASTTPRSCLTADTVPAGKLSVQVQAMACEWLQRGLLIVGELHGSNEAPDLVAALARDAAAHHHAVRIGLEMPTEEQTVLQAYIRSPGSATDQAALLHTSFWGSDDGRSSTAMLRLIDGIRQLRAAGNDVDLFAMEPAYPDRATIEKQGGLLAIKEEGMAKAIKQAMEADKTALVITLMGNFHSRYAGEIDGAPDGSVTERLAASQPYVVLPFAPRASAWNCTDQGCSVHNFNSTRAPQGVLPRMQLASAESGGPLVVKLWLPELTAALPAVAGGKPAVAGGKH